MRAPDPDPPVSRGPAARAGNTRFTQNKDVARGARAKPDPPVLGWPAAHAGSPRFAHNKDVVRRAARAGRPSAKTRSACLKAAGAARGQYPLRP